MYHSRVKGLLLVVVGSWVALLHGCGSPVDMAICSEDNTALAAADVPFAASAQAVTSLTLVNKQTGQTLQTLTADDVIAINQLPAQVEIRAVTTPSQVGSVRFDLDGNVGYHTEDSVPYAMPAQAAAGAISNAFATGNHTVTATPFTGGNLQGAAGRAFTVTFTVDANGASTQNANQATGAQNANASNANASNANNANPNLPVTHIYNFASGTDDQSADVAGRISGTLVGSAALQNGALTTQLSPSASGMRLPVKTFAHYSASFSVEQWFTWAQTANDFESIFSVATDSDHGIMAHPRRGDNQLFSVDLHPGNGQQYSVTAQPPAAGTLTFMAVVYDATANQLKLYMNGSLANTVAIPVNVNLSALGSASYTGVNGFSAFNDPAFNGTTTRFVVQPVALTAAQVAADAANPAGAGAP